MKKERAIHDIKTVEGYNKVRANLLSAFRCIGIFGETASDGAQDIIIDLLKGPSTSTYRQMAIDWARSNLGHEKRSPLTLKDRQCTLIFSDEMAQKIPSKDGYSIDIRLDLLKIIPLIESKDSRSILRLFSFWGMGILEIAGIFEVSESRIHQIIKGAIYEARKKVVKCQRKMRTPA